MTCRMSAKVIFVNVSGELGYNSSTVVFCIQMSNMCLPLT